MTYVLPVIIAYLLGSIPFGLLIPRLFGVPDIRQHGSGNIGATNAIRVLGFKRALWVFLADIGKGVAAVMIARWYAGSFGSPFDSVEAFYVVCGFAAVLGHLFPVYLKFKGGKGVNTALGVMLALIPIEALMALAVFGIVVAITRIVSLSSMSASVALLAIVIIEKFTINPGLSNVYIWVIAALVILILFAHRSNIARLLAGTENRFDRKSPKTPKEAERRV